MDYLKQSATLSYILESISVWETNKNEDLAIKTGKQY